MRISELTLLLNFDQEEAEILGLEQTRGHFQFSHFQVIFNHFSEKFQQKNSKINLFGIFFVRHLVIHVENITESDERCQIEVIKV